MANSNHDHEHDGHVHDGHGHTHDGLPPHSHGEPTGNAIEKIGFTRSQFLRMCLAGVAAGAAAPMGAQAQAQGPKASRPGPIPMTTRSSSTDRARIGNSSR